MDKNPNCKNYYIFGCCYILGSNKTSLNFPEIWTKHDQQSRNNQELLSCRESDWSSGVYCLCVWMLPIPAVVSSDLREASQQVFTASNLTGCTHCRVVQCSHVPSCDLTKKSLEKTSQHERWVQNLRYITHRIKKNTSSHCSSEHRLPPTTHTHTIHTGYSLQLDSLSPCFHFKATIKSEERPLWARSEAGYTERG